MRIADCRDRDWRKGSFVASLCAVFVTMTVALAVVIQSIHSNKPPADIVPPVQPPELWEITFDIDEWDDGDDEQNAPSIAPRLSRQPVALEYDLIPVAPNTTAGDEDTPSNEPEGHKNYDESGEEDVQTIEGDKDTDGQHGEPPSQHNQNQPLSFSGHILCYGDGLTAGATAALEDGGGTIDQVPYGPFLEEALTGVYPRSNARFGNVVDYLGLPGWTAVQMAQRKHHTKFGLATTIERDTNDAIDVVVIQAGTSDLFEEIRNATAIVESIRTLHKVALKSGKVRHTIALEIPDSEYRETHQGPDRVARTVNGKLKEIARDNPNIHHMAFPIPFEQGGEDWASDNLHLSASGYERLGKAIAPVIRQILGEDDYGDRRSDGGKAI